jgi:hypothetical protein
MTALLESTSTKPISFVWTEREDGAKLFYARNSDGSSVEILSAEQLESAEELIYSLTQEYANS